MSGVVETSVKKTLAKKLALALLSLATILLVAVVCIVFWLRSGAGRDFVESRIESMEIVGQSIEIGGLEGSVLGRFTIDEMTLSGRDGVWFVANDVSVSWTPRSILSKTLDIDSLRVGDLDVLQRPILVLGEGGGDPAITTFDIQGVDLPDIALSEPVMGQLINASISGVLRHSPDGGATQLSARSDLGDRIETNLAWSPLLILSGEADIDGVPGGLIAELLRLNSDQRLTADVTTQGKQTNILAEIDGADFADLMIRRGQSSVAVGGRIEPSPLPLLEVITPLLGGAVEFEAVLPLDEDASARLDFRSPNVTLDASGARRDETIALDQFSLNITDPLETFDIDGVGIGRLSAEGRAEIGETYRFEGQIEGQNLAYRDYKVDRLFGPATLTFSEGLLGFDAVMRGAVSDGSLAQADGAKLLAKGAFDVSRKAMTFTQADINLPGLAVQGRGQVGYGEDRTVNFNGRYVVNTAIFRDGPSAKLSGRATVKQTVNGPLIETSGQAKNIENLTGAALTLVPNGFSYTARVRVEGGQVVVPRFTASNDAVTASGTGRLVDGRIMSNIDFAATDYEVATIFAETIRGTAQLSGPPSRLEFKTDLTLDRLKTGALNVSDAALSADGIYAGGVTTLAGTLSGDSPQGPIDTRADLVASDGNWALTSLDSSFGRLIATGSLSGSGGDVAAIRGDLSIAGTSDLVPADAIDAKILLADSQVDIDATLTGLTIAQLQGATVYIVAQGPRNDVTFQIDVDGSRVVADIVRPLILTASGSTDFSNDAFETETDFDISLGGLTLVGLASADRGESGWRANLDATGLGGALQVELDPSDGGAMSFDLKDLSMPQVARLIARPATEGAISGEGRFVLVSDKMEGAAKIRLEDLRSPISDSEPITLVSDVVLANERLTVTMDATEGGLSGQAMIEGNVETLPNLPFLVYPPAVPLQGMADLNGEIGPIVELFLPPQTDVAGQIDTDIKFTVPNTPDGMQGTLSLSGGKFNQGALGLQLANIAMDAELSGETVTVSTFTARGEGGGTLNGSGRMGLGAGTGTVDIRADKLRVLSRREGQAEVSGELNLSRTTELLRLGGTLRVTDADINIERLPKPGLPTLQIDFGETQSEEETRSLASTATEMDIHIVSDGRIKVRGRGLNASMNLDAKVRGPFDAPVVTGHMSIERGRFDFLSKRFEFGESSVVLQEDALQSRLSLEAVRQTSELKAVVEITGTLERPEIKLTSEPNLPEDEVLSRILFGRSPTQLTAIETARLAVAISQLSGGGGFDLFGSLENAIGLDRLEIGQNDTGKTQLTTGKYLSDDVYLEVRTAAEGTPSVAVEWQVRDNVSVEAETLPDEGERLSVQWKKDFD
jgi:translocation and assembly module TamB